MGVVGGKGQVAHHVLGNSKRAQDLHQTLKGYDIDINDPRNGMYLDNEFHWKLNNDDYRDAVIDRLEDSRGKDEVLDELDAIRKELFEHQAKWRVDPSYRPSFSPSRSGA